MLSLKPPAGFTLVELILVMVLLSIMGLVSSQYLGLGAQMYTEFSDRERVLSQGRFALERLVRELRNVVPNSVRVHQGQLAQEDDCIEFMPLLTAGRYTSAPVSPASSNSMTIFTTLTNWQAGTGDYLLIYPTRAEQIYNPSLQRLVQLTDAVQNANEVTLSFNSHSFPVSSPDNRLYLGKQPVSYCLVSGRLWRYTGYGLSLTQPNAATVAANGVLMAEGLKQPLDPLDSSRILPPFVYDAPVLSRNSVVHLFLSFSSNFNDQLFFNQEVHSPNVP